MDTTRNNHVKQIKPASEKQIMHIFLRFVHPGFYINMKDHVCLCDMKVDGKQRELGKGKRGWVCEWDMLE